MKRFRYLFFPLAISALILFSGISCKGGATPGRAAGTGNEGDNPVAAGPVVKLVEMVTPPDNGRFSSGDIIRVELKLTGQTEADSIRVYCDGKLVATMMPGELVTDIGTGDLRLGRIPVKVMAYSGNERPQVITRFINLYSDITPPTLSYRVDKVFPHDSKAYTQGLVYHKGYFLESTGQEGRSSLRRVEIETGQVIKIHNLDRDLFGEGITLFNDRIYQLTWTSKVGFIYDAETFQQLSRIHYDTEGWGITTNGKELIMSDGTNKLYFVEPEYFTILSILEVYDNRQPVNQLNELEYINGEIWANIYQTDMVARIDPSTGKVNAYVDFSGLLSDTEKSRAEVLNGIAWDNGGSRLWVTGKLWPKLFQVVVTR